MSAPVAPGRRPGTMLVRVNVDRYVVWFGRNRFLDKAGEIVKTGVVMSESEARAAAAPIEVTT